MECTGNVAREIVASDPRTAAALFKDLLGSLPDTAGGVAILGECEACKRVLLEEDEHIEDGGRVRCATC